MNEACPDTCDLDSILRVKTGTAERDISHGKRCSLQLSWDSPSLNLKFEPKREIKITFWSTIVTSPLHKKFNIADFVDRLDAAQSTVVEFKEMQFLGVLTDLSDIEDKSHSSKKILKNFIKDCFRIPDQKTENYTKDLLQKRTIFSQAIYKVKREVRAHGLNVTCEEKVTFEDFWKEFDTHLDPLIMTSICRTSVEMAILQLSKPCAAQVMHSSVEKQVRKIFNNMNQ